MVAEIYRNTPSWRFGEQDASLTRHTTRQHISASFPFLVTEIHRDVCRQHVDMLYNASTRVNTSTRPGTYQFFLFRVCISPLPPLRRNSACALQHLTYLPFVISDQPSAFSFIVYHIPDMTHLDHQVCPEGSGRHQSRSNFCRPSYRCTTA